MTLQDIRLIASLLFGECACLKKLDERPLAAWLECPLQSHHQSIQTNLKYCISFCVDAGTGGFKYRSIAPPTCLYTLFFLCFCF